MAEQEKKLTKAKLIELDERLKKEKDGGKQVEVQFNPESLKVSFANQLESRDQSSGSAGLQYVTSSTTKLALQLWFDVSAMEKNPVDDVRRLTQEVAYFMMPQPSQEEANKKAPPGVRFSWGSFIFDGVVEGVEETLEFFSSEGKPLRASLSLTLSQQKILESEFEDSPPAQAGGKPMNAAKQGQTLQNMLQRIGKRDWQAVASANRIEDALRMAPGRLVDLNATGSAGPVGVGARATLGAGASASVGQGLNAALGGAASGSFSIG